MKLPFSVDEFFKVFESYNLSVWPIQFLFYILAVAAVALIYRRSNKASEIVWSILGFFWGWMGLVYHIIFFSSINKAAYFFGATFLVQGFLFLYFGVVKKSIRLTFTLDPAGILALVFIVYALILYPILGYLMGHTYPRTPTLGVPCPTTIFTFGLLLYATNRIPWYLVMVPLLWSIISFSAAVNLSVKEDFGLVVAGAVSALVLLRYKPTSKKD